MTVLDSQATIADALSNMFDRDPNWVSFHSGGHERFVDGEGDNRLCPECGELWDFIWMDIWVNESLNLCAGVDSFGCPNKHSWRIVSPPTDILESDQEFFGLK